MRRLAEQLRVEAMSLYYHVPNKEAILDGVIDLVFREIADEAGGFEVPQSDASWKSSLRRRILAARRVMLRHPWAPGVLDSRSGMGLAQARFVDSVVGTLRSGGLSYDLIHHAMHALGSRMFGFSQELGEEDGSGSAELEQLADQVPHLVGMLAEVAHDDPDSTLGWCDDQFEFEFGLDLILDGLERFGQREAEGR
jgi:AcrR family transcriptional regulator